MNIQKNDIQWVDIESITPYHKNPRRNDKAVQKVAESIKEFGFNQPIVIDENNVVVVGHTRLKASEQLKLNQVPVIYMPDGIDDTKVKAYRIADNKLNEFAEWDDDFLLEELTDIANSDLDFDLTGFDTDDLEKLAGNNDDEWVLPDEQRYMPVFEIAITCKDENEQEKVYLKLQKEGYLCRVLTM